MAQVGLNARPLRAFRPLVRDDRRQIRCARCMVSRINSPIDATRTRAARRRSQSLAPPLLLERSRQVRMRPCRELVSHCTASNPLADWPPVTMRTVTAMRARNEHSILDGSTQTGDATARLHVLGFFRAADRFWVEFQAQCAGLGAVRWFSPVRPSRLGEITLVRVDNLARAHEGYIRTALSTALSPPRDPQF